MQGRAMLSAQQRPKLIQEQQYTDLEHNLGKREGIYQSPIL